MEAAPDVRPRRLGSPPLVVDARPRLERARSNAIGSLHVVPDFLVIGAARAGTTSLLQQLKAHPGTLFASDDELDWFDTGKWLRGPGAYRGLYPPRWQKLLARARGRGPALSGESSPYYLAHPTAPARIRAAIPDVRLIALLRDPTERAISHWAWNTILGIEDRPLGSVVDQELAEPGVSRAPAGSDGPGAPGMPAAHQPRRRKYLLRGLYRQQLERWRHHFPSEQLLILLSEDYYADPATELQKVWGHLGLPRWRVVDAERNARATRATDLGVLLPIPDPVVVARVRAFYRPFNEDLAAYLGRPLPWE